MDQMRVPSVVNRTPQSTSKIDIDMINRKKQKPHDHDFPQPFPLPLINTTIKQDSRRAQKPEISGEFKKPPPPPKKK